MKNKTENIYDNVVYDYKKMDDAPYKLNAAPLRSMQKMERALNFILNNLKQKKIDPSEAAEQAGYDDEYFIKAFRQYFGYPFERFVTMLKLRKAAREIQEENYPKQIGREYGFSTVQSFSKAFSREIGISPREFFIGNYNVPDMPFRKTVKGIEIRLEYREEHAVLMKGVSIKPPLGNYTYLMDSYALPYKENNEECLTDEYHDKVGLWWYELSNGMVYKFGDVAEYYDSLYIPEEKAPDGSIVIEGGNYAVFSYKRPDNIKDISMMSRIMARYIFKEWVPINAKVTNTIGYTYEKFTRDRIYIYLPLSVGMGGTEELKPRRWGIPLWARYIDDHIREPLSLESLAIAAGYSHQNYKDIFTMYYNMTPTTYIRRRRLLLVLNALMRTGYVFSGESSLNIDADIFPVYGFASYNNFCQAFREEFGKEPDMDTRDMNLPDLNEMYEKNNAKVEVSIRNVQDFMVAMHPIEETEDKKVPSDLAGRVLYWFHHDFRDFGRINDYIKKPEEKVSIWGNDAVYKGLNKVYEYYVGSVLRTVVDENEIKNALKDSGAIIEHIPGGRYAVFRTFDETDGANPEMSYHILTVTAFGGWIHDNRWRTDLNRRTFVIWRNSRLFFYVPVVR